MNIANKTVHRRDEITSEREYTDETDMSIHLIGQSYHELCLAYA